MTSYHQYTAVDFAADDFFKSSVCLPDERSNVFWAKFLEEFPEKYYELEEARLLVLNLKEIHPDIATDDRVDRLWSRIVESDERITPLVHKTRFRTWSPWLAAASVVLALVVFRAWNKKPTNKELLTEHRYEASSDWKEVMNTSDDPLAVELPDHSLVILQKNSRVRFPKTFDTPKREIVLLGEAFFEVTKNPEKPFLVYSNGLVTKVLGTSFTIRSVENEPDVTVSVRTGLVSVYSERRSKTPDPESDGIVLTPNQKAVFQKDKSLLSRTLVEKPAIIIPAATIPSFVFEDAPASKVFETLEKVYGVDVVFDEELMKHCTLTMDLNGEDLFQKLTVICKVLSVEYKLIDAQVIIYGKSC